MPLGKNNTDLNATHTNYRNGTPITLPHSFGIAVSLPLNVGNAIPSSGTNANTVTWSPSPTHFGNTIQAGN